MLLGGLLLVLLGGLLFPRLNAVYVGVGHRQSVATNQPQGQAGIAVGSAPASNGPASSSASASTVVPPSASTVLPPVTAGQSEATAPTLQILSPKAGEDVAAPFTVRFLISGIDPATLARLNIRLTIGNPPFYTTMLPIDGLQGSATVPDDKMVSGHRDLVFSLSGVDGAPLASTASVLVAGVTISGRR
jgi:hypothetical protein